jgi:GMP synthase (glutamine-hydrolysing)
MSAPGSAQPGIGPVETVAVVDFGGQYTHLIARRVRNLGVFSRVFEPGGFHPEDHPELVGIILSGGPGTVGEAGFPTLAFRPQECRIPILGLCYGHQLLAYLCGGKVASDGKREYGIAHVRRTPARGLLFSGIPEETPVWMSHGDHVERLPDGFQVTASTAELPVASFEDGRGMLFGLQFHPEVTHTRDGLRMLGNFLDVCRAGRTWTPGLQKERLVERIRTEAAGRPLFLLASGGVDSLVALRLCIEAVGPERVHSLHVDTGFMRKGESAAVAGHLAGLGFSNLRIEDASCLFLGRLAGVLDPEEKRRIIGRLFVEVLDHCLARLGLGEDWLLVQGTIYPDTIESGGSAGAALIKTHHNRVEEIRRLLDAGRVIEPLDELYKDEVRELGLALGLPRHLVLRHPFPGPGLAIRILCSDGTASDPPSPEEQRIAAGLASPFGVSARILPVRSVGVQGDFRTYRHPALVCAERERPEPQDLLGLATLIPNRLGSVNRVVYAARNLTEGDLRLGPVTLTQARVCLLQEVDSLVRDRLSRFDDIWQVPVVSLPLFDASGNQHFVIRPVRSTDAMTADPYPLSHETLRLLDLEVRSIPGAAGVFLDLTSKPPATIEWE